MEGREGRGDEREEGGEEKGGGMDFLSLRDSLRLLPIQVLAQRDEALQKVKVLASEIDNLKDHNVQLVDRAANFKVQAQAKQVSKTTWGVQNG